MAQPRSRVAAVLARLLAGLAVWAGLLLVAASFRPSGSGRALALLAFAGLGAGIYASARIWLRGAAESRNTRRSKHLHSSEFFRTPSGLLSRSRRNIGP